MIPTNVDWSVIAAAIIKAAQAVLAALVLIGVVSLTVDQLAGVVVAVEAVLGIPLSVVAAKRTIPAPPVPPAPPAP